MPAILKDCHVHPFEKEKSKAGMRRFVEAAAEKGLDEITFTEHAPHIPGLGPHGMTEGELGAYVAYTKELRKEMPSVGIRLGIEVDWHPENSGYITEMLSAYDFEYVLGSVHIHSDIYNNEIAGMAFAEIGSLAMNRNIEAVESGFFHAIAHLDFFRWLNDKERFGQWDGVYNPSEYSDLIHRLFVLMEKSGISLEINSSGLHKGFASILPCRDILKMASAYNLDYIYGSDAHSPEMVGSGRAEVMDSLASRQLLRLDGYNIYRSGEIGNEKT